MKFASLLIIIGLTPVFGCADPGRAIRTESGKSAAAESKGSTTGTESGAFVAPLAMACRCADLVPSANRGSFTEVLNSGSQLQARCSYGASADSGAAILGIAVYPFKGDAHYDDSLSRAQRGYSAIENRHHHDFGADGSGDSFVASGSKSRNHIYILRLGSRLVEISEALLPEATVNESLPSYIDALKNSANESCR